jgi:hypothetical protein
MRFLLTSCLLLFALDAPAQPQAPIAWDQPRWAHIAGWSGLPCYTTMRVIPLGDTLLFTALHIGGPVSDTILVCSSFDNGQSFTLWHAITDGGNSVSASFTGSAGRYYAFFTNQNPSVWGCWLRISTDCGLTWGASQQYRQFGALLHGFASDNEVIAKYDTILDINTGDMNQCVIRSTDGGQSWSAPIVFDTTNFWLDYFEQTIGFTRSSRIIVDQPTPTLQPDGRLFVARGDSAGQNWTSFEPLPCPYYTGWGAHAASLAGDTSSEASGVLGRFEDSTANDLQRPFFYHSSNITTGWDDCVPMTPAPHVIPYYGTNAPLNVCQGKLWLIGWEHALPMTSFDLLELRFSANHGKNWYPSQFVADSVLMLFNLSGQIRSTGIDVYWDQQCRLDLCNDYRLIHGTITPDTIPPDMLLSETNVDTIRVGDSLHFQAQTLDNDTLSEVRAIIADSAGQITKVMMTAQGNHVYSGRFRVPHLGLYRYKAEAEDFWENITASPDTGWLSFHTEGWTAASFVISHPSSFAVSVFPNPSNGWPSVQLSPEWFRNGSVTVAVFNVLGQKVWEQTFLEGGPIQSAPTAYVSGVYVLKVSNRTHSSLQKFVVLK